MSHPVWVRGLKLRTITRCNNNRLSHPVWVRGLKLWNRFNTFVTRMNVAPRVGAWIETSEKEQKPFQKNVAPRVGAWIET